MSVIGDVTKGFLALFGIHAANKVGGDQTGQLAILSFIGLVLFIFVAAFVTNLFLKRRKERRARLDSHD